MDRPSDLSPLPVSLHLDRHQAHSLPSTPRRASCHYKIRCFAAFHCRAKIIQPPAQFTLEYPPDLRGLPLAPLWGDWCFSRPGYCSTASESSDTRGTLWVRSLCTAPPCPTLATLPFTTCQDGDHSTSSCLLPYLSRHRPYSLRTLCWTCRSLLAHAVLMIGP